MHPYLLPHLMSGCVKHRIKRSAAFDQASSRYAGRTLAVAGNRKVASIGGWVKRAAFGAGENIFGAGVTSADHTSLRFTTANALEYVDRDAGSIYGQRITNQVFRDPTAWLPFLLHIEYTNATAAQRIRLFAGSPTECTYATTIDPALNSDTRHIGATVAHAFGRNPGGVDYFSGLGAALFYADGLLLPWSAVSAIDPRSGTEAPKLYVGGYGAQGGFYPMHGDAGDAPATAAEGWKDRSGNGNHLTPSGFAVSDFVKDSPTNYRSGGDFRGNFCTMNALDNYAQTWAIQNGGLDVANSNFGGAAYTARGSIAARKGKPWFGAQNKANSSDAALPGFGVVSATKALGGNGVSVRPDVWYGRDGKIYDAAGAVLQTGLAVVAVNAWVNVALDMDAATPTATFFVNGVPQGVPVNLVSGRRYGPAIYSYNGGRGYFEFGAQGFTHAAPAGHVPWCVAALPASKVVKPGEAFVQATGSGAAIVAALAAKRSSWGAAYIQIVRSLSAEGWRWSFGDDAANFLDTSDIANGKLAYPALPGANYWGCCLRVGPQYGVATGEIDHVNGAATSILDGLSSTRKIVILRRVNAGGAWPYHHPDLTAGRLLYLNSNAGETPAGDIANVTATGFDIGAGMATGRYRWIALEDTPGLISIESYTGYGGTGPVAQLGLSPGLAAWKRIDASGDHYMMNSAIDAGNPRSTAFTFSSAGALGGAPSRAIDLLANGFRQVGTPAQADANAAGGKYAVLAIADFAFTPGDCPAQATAR